MVAIHEEVNTSNMERRLGKVELLIRRPSHRIGESYFFFHQT